METSRVIVAALALAAGGAAVWVAMSDYRAAHPARPVAVVSFQPTPPVPAQGGPSASDVSADVPTDAAADGSVQAAAVVPAAPEPDRPADALPRKARKPKAKLRLENDARRGGTSTPAPRPAPTDPRAADPQVAEAAAAARRALALVGSDPEAEAAWVDAINDPARSAHERSDLIEDLNEEGFADPKHLTRDDLPLIERRIALIEQLAPEAMDETNAAAFQEAYKDLLNMYDQAADE